jgi:hypothetical protein
MPSAKRCTHSPVTVATVIALEDIGNGNHPSEVRIPVNVTKGSVLRDSILCRAVL